MGVGPAWGAAVCAAAAAQLHATRVSCPVLMFVLQAAELEASRDRVLRFQANSAAASPRRPLAVVVVQPDGTPTLCLKDGPAAECGAASAGASASGGATAAAERGPMHPVAIDLPGIGATVLLLLPNHRGVVLLGHGSGMWAQEPPLPPVRMESVELVRMQALQAHAAGADEAQQQQQPQPQPQPQPASDEEQESGAAAEQPIH